MAGDAFPAVCFGRAAAAGYVTNDGLPKYARSLLTAAVSADKGQLEHRRFQLPRLELSVWFASSEFRRVCELALVETNDPQTLMEAEIFALHAQAERWLAPLYWYGGEEMSVRVFDRALSESGLRGCYHDLPCWQIYDPAARIGVQSLASPLAIPPWEIASPLRGFLHWAYAAAGLRLTHAATLGQGGAGALLVGAGGSGKSGTTLAGILHGLESVGDDFVVLEQGAAVRAHAILRNFKQDVGGLERAGLANLCRERSLNWQGKLEFDPAIVGRPLSSCMTIRAIFLPHIARASRTAIIPASAHEATLALAPSAVLQLSGDGSAGFRFFADVARRLPAYHLHLSEDPREIAATLSTFLSAEVGDAG
jgi:hypothetical protein